MIPALPTLLLIGVVAAAQDQHALQPPHAEALYGFATPA